MVTLYLNIPKWREDVEGCLSFRQIVNLAIAKGFAIPKRDAERCHPGCQVVLLCQEESHSAEGKLVALHVTGKTESGMLRYDAHIHGLTEVVYHPAPAPLRRTSVVVVE